MSTTLSGTPSLDFTGTTQVVIDNPAQFTGAITNIALGDSIVFSNTGLAEGNAVLKADIGTAGGSQKLGIYEAIGSNEDVQTGTAFDIDIEGAGSSGSLAGDYFKVSESGANTVLTLTDINPLDISVLGPAARQDFGVDGAGVTIGIISDSFNFLGAEAADQAAGALPANVNILKDGAGLDEGRAMAQIVHDIAPGAAINFSAVDPDKESEADYISSIDSLEAAGCAIIVDDVHFPDVEASGDVLDQEVSKAVDDGITYIAAAGNDRHATPPTPIYGHSANPLALTVGAVNILAAPNSGYLPVQVEAFSSEGAVATKPDVTGPDGGATDFDIDSGLNGFFGTSAAGPAVAAVAALMMQENPFLKSDPLEVDRLLKASATDLGAPSNEMGAGFINAAQAVELASEDIPCFATGTGILTPRGEIAVEDLRVGDWVITDSGQHAPILWIGQRRVDCRRHPKPEQVLPFKIRRGAFGPGKPHGDLLLSPDHSIYAEMVLIPIKYLANGTTITQVKIDEVGYHHIELDRHRVIYAEGLPCETYLDAGNRHAFANGGACMQLHPQFAPSERYEVIWEAAGCAPLCIDGEVFNRVATQLRAGAAELGHAPPATTHPLPQTIITTEPAEALNPDWYLSAYQDVARAGLNPARHYEDWGRREGRLPCSDIDLLRALGLVDPFTVMFTMLDVLAAGVDPVAHFCTFGWREQRRPNLYFDTAWYADTYQLPANVNPLLHYVCTGEHLGFLPGPHFNPAWYRQRYGLSFKQSALAHYLKHRRSQHFSPLPTFDVDAYRKQATTLLPHRDPYAHFLAFARLATTQADRHAA